MQGDPLLLHTHYFMYAVISQIKETSSASLEREKIIGVSIGKIGIQNPFLIFVDNIMIFAEVILKILIKNNSRQIFCTSFPPVQKCTGGFM